MRSVWVLFFRRLKTHYYILLSARIRLIFNHHTHTHTERERERCDGFSKFVYGSDLEIVIHHSQRDQIIFRRFLLCQFYTCSYAYVSACVRGIRVSKPRRFWLLRHLLKQPFVVTTVNSIYCSALQWLLIVTFYTYIARVRPLSGFSVIQRRSYCFVIILLIYAIPRLIDLLVVIKTYVSPVWVLRWIVQQYCYQRSTESSTNT